MRALLTPLMATVLCGAPCAPLLAQIHLTPTSVTLREGETFYFHVTMMGAWPQPAWAWTSTGGAITGGANGLGTFVAPRIRSLKETLQVRVSAGNQEAVAEVTVLPSLETEFTQAFQDARMDLLAGDPKASGMTAGPGAKARFGEIVHMARMDGHPDSKMAAMHLLVDALRNQILLMDADGAVQPWLGSPKGKPGRAEGRGAKASFRAPSAAVVQGSGKDWHVLILDAGNHVIRRANADGDVTRVAGQFENPEYLDDAPEGFAFGGLFRSPTGAAYGPDGSLYVTDRENCVIRRIRGGRTSTLAGKALEPGLLDGTGGAARFHCPSAMVYDPGSGNLLVADGHCVRQVTLAGRVTTLAGCDDRGFEEHQATAAGRTGLNRHAGLPCLSSISGLSLQHGQLLITERGNLAVRRLNLRTGELTTLVAGDKGKRLFRPGPLPGGRELAQGQGASLTAPSHILLAPDCRRGLIAMNEAYGSGSCIALLKLAGCGSSQPARDRDGKESKTETAGAVERKAASAASGPREGSGAGLTLAAIPEGREESTPAPDGPVDGVAN